MRSMNEWHSWGRKIVCAARNYESHAKELGNATPSKPFFFLKPPTAYVTQGSPILLPFKGVDLHYEVELGVIIGKNGKNISREDAASFIGGYTLALDMTARCLQGEAKKKGQPWCEAKGFDTSCPISSFISVDEISDMQNVNLKLWVNDKLRQDGNTKDMIFDIPSLIAEASTKFTLEAGDLLLTGTPEVSPDAPYAYTLPFSRPTQGVGAVHEGDILRGEIPGIAASAFEFKVSQ